MAVAPCSDLRNISSIFQSIRSESSCSFLNKSVGVFIQSILWFFFKNICGRWFQSICLKPHLTVRMVESKCLSVLSTWKRKLSDKSRIHTCEILTSYFLNAFFTEKSVDKSWFLFFRFLISSYASTNDGWDHWL